MGNDRGNFPVSKVVAFPTPELAKELIRYGAEQVIYAEAFGEKIKEISGERIDRLYENWKQSNRGIGI